MVWTLSTPSGLFFLLSLVTLQASAEASAAPEDAQALVQQGARVSAIIRKHGSNSLFELLAEQLSKPSKSICTKKELDDFQAKVDAVMKLRTEDANRQMKEQQAIADRLLSPLGGAMKRLEKVAGQNFRIIMGESVREIIPTIMKGKKKADTPLEINMTRLEAKMERVAASMTASVNNIYKDGLRELDQHISAKVDADLHDLAELIPWFKANLTDLSNTTAIGEYFLHKVFPVMLLEQHPELVPFAEIVTKWPSDENEVLQYAMDTVVPTLADKVFPKVLVENASLFMPKRECNTCEEQYQAQTWGADDWTSCVRDCTIMLPTCLAGISGGCLLNLSPCLECHGRRLREFDVCTKTNVSIEHYVRIDKAVAVIHDANISSETAPQLIDETLLDKVISALIF